MMKVLATQGLKYLQKIVFNIYHCVSLKIQTRGCEYGPKICKARLSLSIGRTTAPDIQQDR